MSFKKIVSGALAAAMVLSVSATAFAADTPAAPSPVKVLAETTESEYQVELEGMIYTPTIRVQVTQSGQVYVNPANSVISGTMSKALDGTENLDYSYGGESNDTSYTVASTPILIRSDTDKKLKVSATVNATVPKTSGVVLTDATVSSTGTDKQVKLTLAGTSTELGHSNAIKAAGGLKQANFTQASTGTGEKIAAATDGKSAANTKAVEVAVISAATVNVDPTTKKATTAVPQYGAVVVNGSSAKSAKWTENDIVNVSVSLTFAIDNT